MGGVKPRDRGPKARPSSRSGRGFRGRHEGRQGRHWNRSGHGENRLSERPASQAFGKGPPREGRGVSVKYRQNAVVQIGVSLLESAKPLRGLPERPGRLDDAQGLDHAIEPSEGFRLIHRIG